MGKLLQRLQDATRSDAYRVGATVEVRSAVTEGALELKVIELDRPGAEAALLERVAQSLGLGSGSAQSWTALQDGVTHLRAQAGTTSLVLLIHGADALAAEQRATLIEALRASALSNGKRGQALFAVFLDPGEVLELPALFRPRPA